MHEPKENKEYHAFLLLLTYFTKYSLVTWHSHDGYLPFSVLAFLISFVTDRSFACIRHVTNKVRFYCNLDCMNICVFNMYLTLLIYFEFKMFVQTNVRNNLTLFVWLILVFVTSNKLIMNTNSPKIRHHYEKTKLVV